MKRFVLHTPLVRQNAIAEIRNAPAESVVTISQRTRSNEQNAKMWAMLADVADAKPEGREWTPETWKCAFMHFLGHQVRFCEGLEGTGPFPLGFRSSKLKVGQMADLITCIYQYGDKHGVIWSEAEAGGFMPAHEAAA